MSQVAAVIAALILAGLICFQLLLAAGLPLGNYAWGGAHRILPRSLRIGSVVAIFIYLAVALGILEAASVVMNAISRSQKERRMAFVALALSALCAIVALGL